MRHPLANDQNGDPVDVPTEATAWRVRRNSGANGGRPHNVYDPDTGRPLQIPLDATIDDLRQYGCKPGRYRLDAVTSDGRMIPHIVAVTEVVDEEPVQAAVPAEQVLAVPTRVFESIERLMDTVCNTMQAMSTAFGTVQPVIAEPEQPVESPPTPEPQKPEQQKWAEVLGPLLQQAGPLLASIFSNQAAADAAAATAPLSGSVT